MRNEINDNVMQTNRYSYYVYIIKSFAILFVIAAHLNVVLEEYGLAIKIFSIIWRKVDVIAVPLFLIFSGYYYRRQAHDTKIFWCKKLKRIIIPWLIISTLTYIVKVINDGQYSVVDYLKWVVGYGTWYYFVTILLCFFVIFKFINKNVFLYFCIFLNIVSVVFGEYKINYVNNLIGYYLNIFNKIGYFAFGLLLQKYRFDILLFKNKKLSLIIFVLSVLFLSFCIFNDAIGIIDILVIKIFMSMFCKFVSIYLILCIAWALSGLKTENIFIFIGKSTYFIYLIHMQIVQFILNKLPINLISVIFKPILGLFIMVTLSYIICLICKRVFKCNWLLTITGFKL